MPHDSFLLNRALRKFQGEQDKPVETIQLLPRRVFLSTALCP